MAKLLAILFVTIYLTSFPTNGMYIEADVKPELFEAIGTVASFDGRLVNINVEDEITAEDTHAILIDIASAPIYNLLTGLPASADYIQPDMTIRVAFDQNHQALVVWLNCGYLNSAIFSITVSENIQYYEDYCVFLTTCGKYRFTLAQDTIILHPYYGKLTPDNIAPGQEFFVWVDMITASHPSIVYPDKVVLIYD